MGVEVLSDRFEKPVARRGVGRVEFDEGGVDEVGEVVEGGAGGWLPVLEYRKCR